MERRSSNRRSGIPGIAERGRKGSDSMPLRGSIFKKVFATRKERQSIEKKQLADHFRSQGQELAKIRKQRIEAQGKAKLKNLLADEKRMLAQAKGPSKVSRFEGFLKKEAKKGISAAEFQAKKQIRKQAKKAKRKVIRRKRRKKKPTVFFTLGKL